MHLRLIFLASLAIGAGCGDDDGPVDGSHGNGDLAAAVSCTPTKPAMLDPTLVASGMSLVTANHCQKCHGQDLAGNFDGVFIPGTTTPAYPPNLTPDLDTGLGCWTDAQITNAILNGLDNDDQPVCPPMPHFSEAGLTQSDALAIAAFLRSLPVSVNQVPDTPACQPWGQLGGGCTRDSDCPQGAACAYEYCVAVDSDAGP